MPENLQSDFVSGDSQIFNLAFVLPNGNPVVIQNRSLENIQELMCSKTFAQNVTSWAIEMYFVGIGLMPIYTSESM